MGPTRRRALAAAVFALGVISGGSLTRAQHDRWGASYFPNVVLTTHRGEQVRFYDDLIKGKIVAINLIYTSCKYACPLETARLAQVQHLLGDRMGKDVFFYSISIDPEYDTPDVLRRYAETFRAGPGWIFLTGARADIETISRRTGLYSKPNPANPDGHTPHLLVGNEATGQWLRNSGVDDPRVLATTIGKWLDSWRSAGKPSRSYADAPTLTIPGGEYVFRKHCAACHTIGAGNRVGPDLRGVHAARTREWLTRFISRPDLMRASDATARSLAETYRPAVMPTLGLRAEEVAQVIGYIEAESSRGPAAPPPAASAAVDLRALLDPYVRVQQALSGDSLRGVREQAREIRAAALRADGTAAIVRAAERLDRSSRIVGAREAFTALSDAVIAYIRTYRVPLPEGVRIGYCPMLRKYWFQRGDALRNPFYGSQMLDCGRFVPALPAGGS